MKRLAILISLTALAAAAVSCNKDNPANNPYKPLDLSTKSAQFAQQGNTFAFNLLDRVNDATQKDFVISPLSLQFLLGMILDGAQGQTADEICQVLGYGAGEVDAVNEYSLSMLQQLPKLDKKTTLAIANAIVVNKNYVLLDSYKSEVSQYYQAEVSNLDFSDKNGTANTINQWCSKQTNKLIPEIIKPQDVSSSVLAYLMNALYFKSQWKEKFPKGSTSNEAFTKEDGSKSTVSMMKINEDFTYQEDDVMRVVNLPYGNGAFSMLVILPTDGKKLSDVTNYLNGQTWADFRSTMVRCDVDLWLPKFETKFEIQLKDILCAMGMPLAFTSSADFKAMSLSALYLSFVKQNAVIKVDEEGTEAAAVSMAVMKDTSAAPGAYIVFHAQQPFLYLITESSTGAILFAGKVTGN